MVSTSCQEASFGTVRAVWECRAAEQVGGDYVRLFDRGDGHVIAFLGDVCGKGEGAARVLSRVTPHLEQLVDSGVGPAELLAQLNDRFARGESSYLFMTAVCLDLDVRTGRVKWANAGHVPVLLKRPNGAVVRAAEPSGPPLGIFGGQRYVEEESTLAIGTTLLLVTDGVSDAFEHEGDRLGLTTLATVLARLESDPAVVRRVIVREAASLRAHPDDATVLVMHVAPPVRRVEPPRVLADEAPEVVAPPAA